MYSEETQNYELVTLSEIKFAEGTPHCYYGKSYLKIGDTEYDNEFHSAFHGSNYYFGIYLFYYDNKNNEGFVFKGNN